jgi:hypothetical protein
LGGIKLIFLPQGIKAYLNRVGFFGWDKNLETPTANAGHTIDVFFVFVGLTLPLFQFLIQPKQT